MPATAVKPTRRNGKGLLGSMPRLTDTQRALADDFVSRWNVVSILRRKCPGLYRACLGVGMDDDDIEQVGALAAMRAAQSFDPSRGAQFVTYCFCWLRSTIGRAVKMNDQRRIGNFVSGDMAIGDDDDRELWELLIELAADECVSDDVGESDRLDELRRRVERSLRRLPARHREVIERRFGMNGHEAGILADIGVEMGITRERVRQIEAKAMEAIAIPLTVACFDLICGDGR